MKVYLVYVEYQKDSPFIVSVFTKKEEAEVTRARLVAEYQAAGEIVFNEPIDTPDWTVDVHVEVLDLHD